MEICSLNAVENLGGNPLGGNPLRLNSNANREYLPEKIAGTKLYEPAQNQRENEMRTRLKMLWKEKYGY